MLIFCPEERWLQVCLDVNYHGGLRFFPFFFFPHCQSGCAGFMVLSLQGGCSYCERQIGYITIYKKDKQLLHCFAPWVQGRVRFIHCSPQHSGEWVECCSVSQTQLNELFGEEFITCSCLHQSIMGTGREAVLWTINISKAKAGLVWMGQKPCCCAKTLF